MDIAGLHPFFSAQVGDTVALNALFSLVYEGVTVHSYEDYYLAWGGELDGSYVESEKHSVWVRNPLRVRSPFVAEILADEEVWAVHDEKAGEDLHIALHGACIVPPTNRFAGLGSAERITLEKADGTVLRDLNRVVLTPDWSVNVHNDVLVNGQPWEAEQIFAVKGSPQTLLQTLRAEQVTDMWGLLVAAEGLHSSIYDYLDGSGEEATVSARLSQQMIREFSQVAAAMGDMREYTRHAAVVTASEQWWHMRDLAETTLRTFREMTGDYPEVSEIGQAITLLEQVTALEVDARRWLPDKVA